MYNSWITNNCQSQSQNLPSRILLVADANLICERLELRATHVFGEEVQAYDPDRLECAQNECETKYGSICTRLVNSMSSLYIVYQHHRSCLGLEEEVPVSWKCDFCYDMITSKRRKRS